MLHFLACKRCVDSSIADQHGLIYCGICHGRIGFRVMLTDAKYSVWVEPKYSRYEDEINKKFAHKTGNSSLEDEMRQIVESVKEISITDDECAFYGEEPIEERGVWQ